VRAAISRRFILNSPPEDCRLRWLGQESTGFLRRLAQGFSGWLRAVEPISWSVAIKNLLTLAGQTPFPIETPEAYRSGI